MTTTLALAVTLHLLAALVWVGGMFFAHLALRPAAAAVLEPPLRLTLWEGVLRRFFRWVWGAVAVLLVTGYGIVFVVYGGFAATRPFVHLMSAGGLLMVALFAWVYFVPFARMGRAIADQDWPAAARQQGRIRTVVAVNLALGLATSVVGVAGRYL